MNLYGIIWNFQRKKVYILKSRKTCINNKKEFKGKETIKSVKYQSSTMDATLKENRSKADPEI